MSLPGVVRPVLRKLGRRLAVGLFVDIWPAWAMSGLLLSGTAVLVCRMFFPGAARVLPWLWLVPIAAAIPVLVICFRRAYQPADVAAIADWLGGGQGILLTLAEADDPAWARSALVDRATMFTLPRLRLRRALLMLLPSLLFLGVALALPQRMPGQAATPALAEKIASDLKAAVVELKQQELITPAEEERLEQEIERIRKSAEERVDASSWEAADALREQVVAGLSEKQDAVKWAQDSLARFAAAVEGGGTGAGTADAQSAELRQALEKLAESGLLAGAPANLKGLLKGGKFPTDPAALAQLTADMAKYLEAANGKFGDLAGLGAGFGRFDPSEFSTGAGPDADDGYPGRGGVNRGRADAALTWGQETQLIDKFTSKPLPPGSVRSPDDWAPVVSMPGAPEENAVLSTQSAARQYSAAAGQEAWRRTLAPRHQSAVKKYFDTTPAKPIKKDRDHP